MKEKGIKLSKPASVKSKSSGQLENDQEFSKTVRKYARGSLHINTKDIKHKGLRKTLQETRDKMKDAATRTAEADILLPQDDGFIQVESNEKIYKLKQKEILDNVDINTAKNAFDLQLTNFGPYIPKYSRNGRFLLFAGKKGHVAIMDNLRSTVGMELQLEERIHDVVYLHNETLFAAAQEKYTYIYDRRGTEIHCIKRHERPLRLDFLPYHFLLTSISQSGWVKWHDVSIGEYVAGYQTGFGACKVLKHNPQNGVSHIGHTNGVVSLWSPAAGKSLVSMFCHKSPINDLAIDRDGRYMVTAGLDGYLKIWDLRKFSNLHTYKLDQPANSIDISAKGLIALGIGRTVQVLKNAFTQPMDVTYLQHSIRTPNANLSAGAGALAAKRSLLSSVSVNRVVFRLYEDVVCAGHSHGITTVIVPGSGEPNFDSFESNPFHSAQQRKEDEVQKLLNKLSYEMIGLDSSFIGTIEKDNLTLQKEQNEVFQTANKKELEKKTKNKKRGRNKISAKLRRKQKNVVDAQLLKLKEKRDQERKEREKQINGENTEGNEKSKKDALSRFLK